MAKKRDDSSDIFGKVDDDDYPNRLPSAFGRNGKVSARWARYVIEWDPRDQIVDTRPMLIRVARAEKRIATALGAFPETVTIDICWTEDELRNDGGGLSHPGWIGGTYDGRIRVLSDPLRNGQPDSLYVYLTHEMVHAALAAIEGERPPCWFEEGLAVHLSQNLPVHYRAALATALHDGTHFPLTALRAPFTELDAAQIPLAYAQATSVVEYFTETLGRHEPERTEGLRAAVSRAKRSGFLAMLRSRGLTLSHLERDWRRWATRRR